MDNTELGHWKVRMNNILFNGNSVTTELAKETLLATAAVLRNGRIMIQSELHSNMERQAETTCPPVGGIVC